MIMIMIRMILSASVVNIYSTLEYPVNSPRSQGKRSNRELTLFQEIPPASHEQNSLRPWSFCLSSFSNCRISTSNFRPWACSSKAFFSPSARHSLHQAIRNHHNHVSTFPQRKLWSQLVQVLCSWLFFYMHKAKVLIGNLSCSAQDTDSSCNGLIFNSYWFNSGCYCNSLTFSNLLLWASGLPTAVVGHWWRAKWLKLTQWPCLSGPKMNWTGPDENDWTFLKHFLNTCGIESVWPRAAVSWVAFFNLGFQILQRFPDASDCEHEQKFSEWLQSCGAFLNVSMMQLVKWMWLTPRVWLSRTCFLNSSWRFLNIISFSCEVLQGTWHSKMPNSQPYLQHPSTSFFRFLP